MTNGWMKLYYIAEALLCVCFVEINLEKMNPESIIINDYMGLCPLLPNGCLTLHGFHSCVFAPRTPASILYLPPLQSYK